MRKFLLSAIAVSTLTSAAAPAAAQYYPAPRGNNYGYVNDRGISQQLANLSQRVDRAFQRRAISSNEARRLQREINQTARLSDRYARNGLTGWERQDLQNRLQNLRQQIREDRRDGRNDRHEDRRDDRRYDRDDDRRWDRDDDDDD